MPANLAGEATAFLILFARVGAVTMLLPAFGDEALPGRIRLLLALGVTLALFPMLRAFTLPLVEVDLLHSVPTELLIGLAIGTLVRIIFLAAAMAGSVISVQVGLTSSLVFDPATGGHLPSVAKLITVAATVLCLSLGVHHLWFAGLVESYRSFPPAQWPDAASWLELALSTVSTATSLALELAAPFIIYGILFNTALGFSTRLAPAIQIFFIAQPLNIVLGLALLAVTVGAILTHFADGLAAWFAGGWAHV